MRHYLYPIDSVRKAPAAGGDMKSWFYFYKWDVVDETFVPVTGEYVRCFCNVTPGDLLWFAVNKLLVGYVEILRVEQELSQGLLELWYDASHKKELERPKVLDLVVAGWCSEGERWLEEVNEVR